jgi:hypothetical protein
LSDGKLTKAQQASIEQGYNLVGDASKDLISGA